PDWKIAKHAPAREGRPRNLGACPVEFQPALHSFGVADQLTLLAAGKRLALLLLHGSVAPIELGPLLRTRETIDHTDGARRILDVNDGLVIGGRNLHGRVLGAGGGAADQERDLESFALHLAGDVDHLIE